MKRYVTRGMVLVITVLAAGCNDFLAGEGLTENPNNPLAATAQQEMIAIQANMATRHSQDNKYRIRIRMCGRVRIRAVA